MATQFSWSLIQIERKDAQIERLQTALEKIRFTEGISRLVEKIALDALADSKPETKT